MPESSWVQPSLPTSTHCRSVRQPFSHRRRPRYGSATRRVEEVCRDAVTTAELIEGLCTPFNETLGLSGLLLSATDPHTTALGTATVVEHLPQAISAAWMQNEILEDDFNKFADLHRNAAPASTLHRATSGRPELSRRHRGLHRPHGLGPELRATFSVGNACWGVANLVREDGDPDFDDRGLAWLEELRPLIAAGIRRTSGKTIEAKSEPETAGVVSLDPDCAVLSMTAGACRMLADLWLCPFEGSQTFRLPGEAYMVGILARGRAEGFRDLPPAVTRLQGRSGRWLTIRGDYSLTPEGKLAGLILMIEPSRPIEIVPFVIAAYGITPREREVLALLIGGLPTGAISDRLRISKHTVRDHVKSMLAKTGTASRAELISMLLSRHAG